MATPLLQPGQLVALDAEGKIAADLPCAACGYLLRTQRPDGQCPECGHPIEETLNASNIRLIDLHWLRQIQTGAVCFAIAIPGLFLFGLGLLVWLLGVAAVSIEMPEQPRALQNIRRLFVGAALLGGLSFIGILIGASAVYDGPFLLIPMAVFILMVGLHAGAVLRLGAVVSREAQWPSMRVFGNVLSWVAWSWPILMGGTIVLMSVSFSYAWGGQGSTPTWLTVIGALVTYGTFFGTLGLLGASFVFWIIVAVRMRRIRQEAQAIYRERQLLASAPQQV